MKHKFWALLLAIAVTPSSSQSNQTPAEPNLRKFSSQQLRACFPDKSVCGASDEVQIAGELANRLPSFATKQLVACFADWQICGTVDSTATGWPIADEIARRGDPHALLTRYWKERNPLIRYGIVQVAYHFHSAEVTSFMERVLAGHRLDAEGLFWAADYLADQCNPKGLHWLSTRKGRKLGCIQFAGTVKVFGKCKYRQSIPYLVDYSLQDACLNVVGDAEESLEKLYPDHPKQFESLEAEQQYYCRRAKQEGFKVHCDSK